MDFTWLCKLVLSDSVPLLAVMVPSILRNCFNDSDFDLVLSIDTPIALQESLTDPYNFRSEHFNNQKECKSLVLIFTKH